MMGVTMTEAARAARFGRAARRALAGVLGAGVAASAFAAPAMGQALLEAAANPQQESLAANILNICPRLAMGPFNNDPGASPIEEAQAAGTDEADLFLRCNGAIQVANSDQAAASDVLQSIAAEEVLSQDAVISGTVRPQTQALSARIAALGETLSTRLAGRTDSTPYRVADASGAMMFDAVGALGGAEVGAFVNGFFFTGDQDATSLESGFDFDGAAITAGADVAVTDQIIVGGSIGYTDTELDFDAGAGELSSDAISIGGYALAALTPQLQVSGLLSYSFIDYESERVLQYEDANGVVDRVARGETDANQFAFSATASYDFTYQNLIVGPIARVSFINQDVDAFEEEGAGGLDLAFEDQDNESVTTGLGVAASMALSQSFGVLTPYARAEWEREYADDARVVNLRYVNDPFLDSPAIQLQTNDPDRNRARIGGGVSALFRGGVNAFVDYETVVGLEDVSAHQVSVGVRTQF